NGKISIKAAAKKYEEANLNDGERKVIEYKTETEKKLGNIIKTEFSHEAGRDDNLLSLGMDSLEVVGLSKNIEDAFKVSVPVSYIFESPYIENISEYIDRSLNGEDLSLLEKDKSYLRDEVVLDESIKPGIYESDNPVMK
ncbi:MAG: acyl carrier protein, partial [Clostridium sp.]|nr:acyl carrier protein [Clostridium sp.]